MFRRCSNWVRNTTMKDRTLLPVTIKVSITAVVGFLIVGSSTTTSNTNNNFVNGFCTITPSIQHKQHQVQLQTSSSSSSSSNTLSVASSKKTLSLSTTTSDNNINNNTPTNISTSKSGATMMSSSKKSNPLLSWIELQNLVSNTPVGHALDNEVQLRLKGMGSPHVHNRLRLFNEMKGNDDEEVEPQITFYRDHAGWCPYCQKTMLLIEEKQIPIKIELVAMRSYGDKPREFLNKVPSGLLPAIEVNGQIITESQVIMDLLDRWHPKEDGYKPMLPSLDDEDGRLRYTYLARLERELFSWWCTVAFRPEGPSIGGGANNNNLLKSLFYGGSSSESIMSPSMKGFMDCIRTVDDNLLKTNGPWFFDTYDHPTMIDFVFVSHVERMLASLVYWKGLNLRDPKWNLIGLNRWLEAFEQREAYLAFKSDYYTHIKDIPPQYGPGYNGGFEKDRIQMSNTVLGLDGSWSLPLPHDDPLQPLYTGPPLPLCVLESMNLHPDTDGTFNTCDPVQMSIACATMAGWKLANNGIAVAKFASRGGPLGSKNHRKTFGAELADPYATPDESILPTVDAVLRVICLALIGTSTDQYTIPTEQYKEHLLSVLIRDDNNKSNNKDLVNGVVSSLRYLRDRVGVPRDLPLASARYLRAYLNWAIDILLLQQEQGDEKN